MKGRDKTKMEVRRKEREIEKERERESKDKVTRKKEFRWTLKMFFPYLRFIRVYYDVFL